MRTHMKTNLLKILFPTFLLLACFSYNVTASALPDRGSNISGNFTMLNESGDIFGGIDDITFEWDNTVNTAESDTNFNMSIASISSKIFFGFPLNIHHVRVFGEGTYIFETDNVQCSVTDIEITGCPGDGGATSITMTVGNGQFGAHMLFDYNNDINIDIVNVWDVNGIWEDAGGPEDLLNNIWGDYTVLSAPFALVSRDADGDGINGIPIIDDAAFKGFNANFNLPLPDGDYDYDGVPDESDNCVFYSNLDQADSNRDGVGDKCDFPGNPQSESTTAPSVGNISILFSIVIALFKIASRIFNRRFSRAINT